MTTQEAYEKIREWFLTDRRLGWDDAAEACVYRATDGARCAIGCLIPDGNTMLQCDGDISLLFEDFESDFIGLFGDDDYLYDFLARAQLIHDGEAGKYGSKDVEKFIARLDAVAASEYGLTVPA